MRIKLIMSVDSIPVLTTQTKKKKLDDNDDSKYFLYYCYLLS